MADIGTPTNWLVSPDAEIEKKWVEVQIQERRSRIVRYRQDIEDLQKGKMLDLEARIMMLEREIENLEQKKRTITVE
jgi:hypothetical protein